MTNCVLAISIKNNNNRRSDLVCFCLNSQIDVFNKIINYIPSYENKEKFDRTLTKEIDEQIIAAIIDYAFISFQDETIKIFIEINKSTQLCYFDIIKPKNKTKIFHDDSLNKAKSFLNRKYTDGILFIKNTSTLLSFIIIFESSLRKRIIPKTKPLNISSECILNVINGTPYPLGRSEIVKMTGYSPRTVSYSLDRLLKSKYIKRINANNGQKSFLYIKN